MNHDSISLALAATVGIAIGAIFFGGLWWTVRNCLHSWRPAVWLSISLIVRTSIALGGFYLVGWDDWKAMLACLLGFIVARIVVHARTAPLRSEARRAP